MGTFHHHPDGLIYVRTPTANYGDTVENFAADFATTTPVLPPGAIERIYKQQGPHVIIGPDGPMGEGPKPWPYGDDAINNVAAGIAAQAARNPPRLPPTPPTLDEIYDRTIQDNTFLKAVILALNDGSLPVGQNRTGAQIKAAIKAKM